MQSIHPPKPARPPSPTARARLFALHGWIGITLGLLLFVVCLTGAAAVLSDEIDWLVQPGKRITPVADTPPATPGQLLATARAAYPGARFEWIEFPPHSGWAVEIDGYLRDSDEVRDIVRVYLHPQTAELTGAAGWYTVQRVLRNFHMNLFLDWAFYVVGALGVILLASVVTGTLIHRRWWRGLFTLRLRRGRRTLYSDLHKFLGAWSLAFSLLIGLTGAWYLVEATIWDTSETLTEAIEPAWPEIPASRLATLPPNAQRVPLDTAVAAVRAAYPELRITMINLPAEPATPYYFEGQDGSLLVRSRAAQAFVDPWTGGIMEIRRPADLDPAKRWVHTADPLHFGDFGGLPTQLLWAVLGLALPALILTGSILWLRRRQPAQARTAVLAASAASLALLGWAAFAGISEITSAPPVAPPDSKPLHSSTQPS